MHIMPVNQIRVLPELEEIQKHLPYQLEIDCHLEFQSQRPVHCKRTLQDVQEAPESSKL